jgi:hypothetical protein
VARSLVRVDDLAGNGALDVNRSIWAVDVAIEAGSVAPSGLQGVYITLPGATRLRLRSGTLPLAFESRPFGALVSGP